MQRFRTRALMVGALTVFAVTFSGCDEILNDLDTELDPDLVGEWIALSGTLTNAANSAQSVDMVSDFGAFLAITFNDDGTVAVVEYDPEGGAFGQDGGTWSTSGDELTIHWTGDAEAETVTYQFNTAGHIIVNVGEEDFDFNGDGTDELAELVFTFASADGNPDAALEATWNATSMIFTSIESPSTSVDVIEMGATFSVTFDAAGSYTTQLTYPDGEGGTVTEDEAGAYVALEGLLWVDAATDPTLLHYAISGGVTTVNGSINQSFDFDDDGVEEPATLEMTLSQ